jgi:hypothetical protein
MGGYAALLYTRYAKRTVCQCIAKYPVCDLAYHFTEREDVARTMLSAFWSYDEWGDVIKEKSQIQVLGLKTQDV